MYGLMTRIDINQIADRIDIEALVANTELGALMASSSSTLATETVDRGRSHAVSMDDTTARWVSRLRRNHAGRADRLARDYERDPTTSEAMIRWAAINTMASRVVRGEPATRQQRWHRPGES